MLNAPPASSPEPHRFVLRNRHLLFSDAALLLLSPFVVYALRFEGFDWSPEHLRTAIVFALVALPIRLAVFQHFGLYRRLWRYASIAELELIFVAGVTASIICSAVGGLLLPEAGLTPVRVPLSVLFTNGLLSIGVIAAPRLWIRVAGWRSRRLATFRSDGRRVLIAGAGSAGQMIVRELREASELEMVPVGFVDDDPSKHGLRLAGLPVLGYLRDTKAIVEKHQVGEVIIAMPRASGNIVREVVRGALDAGIKARTIPGLSEILSGRVNVSALREVEIDDLLRREPIRTDLDRVKRLATGRTVLVTGAGGSIGSELARQIAHLSPARLLLLDHAENPIFHIQNELRAAHPGLVLVPVIADVRDRRRMFSVMERHKPFAVFHAAAHKHVPLMEENPIEAITNNVKGTQNLVDAAGATEVEHFVFISTDKAVRPTSVMGCTKRLAEHVVRHAAQKHGRNYVAVRFGNVLGSQGSVVPTFMKQIRAGGPVTVTHPEMRRFFMTIPEAVQLVLQAGAMGSGGELFMLDMGEPVKIVDLAADLIRLSGLEPGADIEIQFTGMRPGEKLYEEMYFDHELSVPTDHPKVLCLRDQLEPWGMERINDLISATMQGCDDEDLRGMLRRLVPDYAPDPNAPVVTPDYPLVAIEREPGLRTSGPRRRSDGARRVSGASVLPMPYRSLED